MRTRLSKIVLVLLATHLLFASQSAQESPKAELTVQTGCFSYLENLTFSPDGKLLAAVCRNVIKLIDMDSGKEVTTIESDSTGISSIAFSPDGKRIVSGWNSLTLWDVSTGKAISQFAENSDIRDGIVFNRAGDLLASFARINLDSDADIGETIDIWNVETGNLFKKIDVPGLPLNAGFRDDGSLVTIGPDWVVSIWDIKSEKRTAYFDISDGQKADDFLYAGHSDYIWSPIISSDGNFVVSYNDYQRIVVWDTRTGKKLRVLDNNFADIITWEFDSESEQLCAANASKVVFWDLQSGKKTKDIVIAETPDFEIMAIDPAGDNLVFSKNWQESDFFEDSTLLITDVDTQSERFVYRRSYKPLKEVAVSHNEELIVSISGDILGDRNANIQLWSLNSRIESFQLNDEPLRIWNPQFSPNDEYVAAMTHSGTYEEDLVLRVWNVDSKTEVTAIRVPSKSGVLFYFSTDNKYLITEEEPEDPLRVWLVEDGREIKDPGIVSGVSEADFADRSIEFESLDYEGSVGFRGMSIKLSGLGIEFLNDDDVVAYLIPLDETGWVVTTPDGLFDATAESRKLLHYVIGTDPILLEQMKDVYYVPGLLNKIFDKEPLPKVRLFSNKDLNPDILFSPPGNWKEDFTIKLINRGGGIGRVQILVNGKEVIADARPAGFDSAGPEALITVNLKDAPLFIDADNKIEVVARNANGSLTNRGTARGVRVSKVQNDAAQRPTPNIYAIVAGISDYTGSMDLKFAAKDAEDFARALELGAISLLGDPSKVHIRLLTSNGPNSNVKFSVADAKTSTATKQDIRNAFADFRNAAPDDVFIVYMAGHGVSLNINGDPNNSGGDTYLFLTQEATTTDKSVLSVSQTRQAMAVSSEELTELMKQNKALKQVLILDTCAAGALSNSLVGKRDLPSDQIRAIERLKDNTGFFVLMGSAADAVSYEASQYGQGLLTYSLLQGMKGARLREDQFADIGLLFGYAQETVPSMAKNIGGIQRPMVITPDTSGSFDIGKFTSAEKAQISLAAPKPIIIRPNLRSTAVRFDNLKLTQMLAGQLREINALSGRGDSSPIIYVETDEMTDAIQPVGDYKVEGPLLELSVILVRNNRPVGNEIVVRGNAAEPEKVIKALVEKMMSSLERLKIDDR